MTNDKDSAVLADAIEDNLEYLQNHEYNPFEPDNQSQAFSVVVELSVQLAPILEALRQTTQSDAQLDAEGVKLYWYRQGKDDGVEHERAKIVAWLRKEAIMSTDTVRRRMNKALDQIEAGEHLK